MNHESLTPANNLPVGAQLRAARLTRNLSQAEFAALAGIRVKHYQRIETGSVLPRLGTLTQIAFALGLRVALVADSEEDV
ncbi:MAG: helix-turn-helix domain-containing protein [Chloroflexi bacterium]|nr:helix-turn-helix domain-containing protein [Chloroflexota bacterium]